MSKPKKMTMVDRLVWENVSGSDDLESMKKLAESETERTGHPHRVVDCRDGYQIVSEFHPKETPDGHC